MKQYYLDDLCPGVEMVRIGTWYIKEGALVEQGVKIADFESTKVNFEVYAPVSGKISQIYVLAGNEVNHSAPLIAIDTN